MKTLKTLLALLAALPLAAPSHAGDKIIYGEDDRVDYHSMPAGFRQAADSTVSLWQSESLEQDPGTGRYRLRTYSFGKSYRLCKTEKFWEQEAGANCSGALVGEDLVLTAGHCVQTQEQCAATKFVFGFAAVSADAPAPRSVPADDVYGCSSIIKRDWVTDETGQTPPGPDYALIKLDRKVSGRKPLAVDRTGGPKTGDPLFITGHPFGLPLKFAGNAKVIYGVDPALAFFRTNLDTFGGNSGSPVFNAATGLIVGIHVRGEGDNVIPSYETGCSVLVVRPAGFGRGAGATKVGVVAEAIPPTAGETAAQTAANTAVAGLRAGVPPLGKTAYFEPRGLITY